MINSSIWDAVLEHVESNVTHGSYSCLKEKGPVPAQKDILSTPEVGILQAHLMLSDPALLKCPKNLAASSPWSV